MTLRRDKSSSQRPWSGSARTSATRSSKRRRAARGSLEPPRNEVNCLARSTESFIRPMRSGLVDPRLPGGVGELEEVLDPRALGADRHPLYGDSLEGKGGAEGEEEKGGVLGLDAHAGEFRPRVLDLDRDGVEQGPLGRADFLEGGGGQLGDRSLRPGLGVPAAALEDEDDTLQAVGQGLGPVLAPEFAPDPAGERVDDFSPAPAAGGGTHGG